MCYIKRYCAHTHTHTHTLSLSIYLYWCAAKALTIMTSVRKRGVSTVSRESVSREGGGPACAREGLVRLVERVLVGGGKKR